MEQLNIFGRFSNGRLIYRVPKNAPTFGYIAFGIVDRGTNVLQVRPTTICPQNCIFCSVDAGTRSTHRWAEYIVEPEAIVEGTTTAIAEKESNVEALLDTVGDVLTYPRLVDLVKSLRETRGVKSIALETHGLLLSKQLVDRLAEAGLSRINLSLETLNAEKASYLYGTGAYRLDRVVEVAEYVARETPIDLHVSPVWLPGINDKDIVGVINWALRIGAGKKWPPVSIQKFVKHKHGRGYGLREVSWVTFWHFIEDLQRKLGTRLKWNMSEWGMYYTKRVRNFLREGNIVEVNVISRGWLRGEYLGSYQRRSLVALFSDQGWLRIGQKYQAKVLSNKDGLNLAKVVKPCRF
ncbi:MAG: radical SAM protein [Desulfurococcaceae archaeon]